MGMGKRGYFFFLLRQANTSFAKGMPSWVRYHSISNGRSG